MRWSSRRYVFLIGLVGHVEYIAAPRLIGRPRDRPSVARLTFVSGAAVGLRWQRRWPALVGEARVGLEDHGDVEKCTLRSRASTTAVAALES